MSSITRDGLSLSYHQEGSGDPPMVFVHGWCCNREFFIPQYNHFKASHAVTTLDLRGCGNSECTEDSYDIPTHADDIVWLCGKLGIHRPIIVGHSLGGLIAIDLAARCPALPAAIVAVDPGPIDPLPEHRAFFEDFARQLEGPNGASTMRSYVERMVSADEDAARRSWIVDTMDSVPKSIASAALRGIVDWNGAEALRKCEPPLLILLSSPGGSNDPSRLLAIKSNIHVGITVGAGHFHQFEVPEQVTPMIERFMKVTFAR